MLIETDHVQSEVFCYVISASLKFSMQGIRLGTYDGWQRNEIASYARLFSIVR